MVKKTAPKDWHRADIIAAIRKTGTNLQQLSRGHGLGRTTLSNALYGPCPRYERLIAEHLDVTPQIIWPSRYHLDGSPRSGRGERGIGRYKAQDKLHDTPAEKSRNGYSGQHLTHLTTSSSFHTLIRHIHARNSVPIRNIDKHAVIDIVEDALTDTKTSYGQGIVVGLCGAFYMCGLFSVEEWESFLLRIVESA